MAARLLAHCVRRRRAPVEFVFVEQRLQRRERLFGVVETVSNAFHVLDQRVHDAAAVLSETQRKMKKKKKKSCVNDDEWSEPLRIAQRWARRKRWRGTTESSRRESET